MRQIGANGSHGPAARYRIMGRNLRKEREKTAHGCAAHSQLFLTGCVKDAGCLLARLCQQPDSGPPADGFIHSGLCCGGRATGPDPSERASMSPTWIKSSLSFANGNCVEVADLPDGTVGIRNSRDSDGPVLRFTPDEWVAFLAGARRGEFDRLGWLRG